MYWVYLRVGKDWVLVGGGNWDFAWSLLTSFGASYTKSVNLECQELWQC